MDKLSLKIERKDISYNAVFKFKKSVIDEKALQIQQRLRDYYIFNQKGIGTRYIIISKYMLISLYFIKLLNQ